ncbi:hypothetical protein AB6806_23865 [Bosea sp. RCC_152_1]|uniref:phage nozzle protein n=1 Tax=Bosea sp. RCC_152_1 TaxID=3239228 RepID=UPI0035236E5B
MGTATVQRIVSGSVPNFINGVSQQPFALRLASQAEEQINGHSSIVEGLTKRPPSKAVAKLTESLPDNVFVHVIDRDEVEKYIAIAYPNGDLEVYDFAGNRKTVNFPSGKAYLVNPSANLKAITIADYTFFLNRDTATAMGAETQPVAPPAAIVYVRQGNYATNYRIIINQSVVAQLTTSKTEPAEIQTDAIAGALLAQMQANLPGWGFACTGSVIRITAPGSADFTIRTEDGAGNTFMLAAKGKVQSFVDLPAKCYDGYQIEVFGSPGNDHDNFYVQYKADAGMDPNLAGLWKEIPKPGRKIALDPATMPHTLKREADGTFTFGPADWNKCGAGDSKTVPEPGFIGSRISDIFFFRNRLGFTAQEHVVLSKSGDIFNFWRDTATALIDTDVIDVTVSHTKVSNLRRAIPFNQALLLMADQTQFILQGGEVLSPATVSIAQTTEYETDNLASPVAAGSFIYFTTSKFGFAGIREFYVDGTTKTNHATDITAHVPKYLKGRVTDLAASTNEDVLVALTDTAPNTVFVYKYFWASGNGEKLQSSWSRWVFEPTCAILAVQFLESTLWLIMRRSDGLHLERIDLSPGVIDEDMPYQVLLDHRYDHTNTTFVTEPHSELGFVTTITKRNSVMGVQVVALAGDPDQKAGRSMRIIWETANAVRVQGVVSKFVVGVPYSLRYKFSTLVLRKEAVGGGQMAATEGRLQVRRMSVNYAETGYFRIIVTPLGRDSYTTVFTGRVVGSLNNRLGFPAIETGVFRFPIMCRNLDASIELINDTPFPTRILNADWEALYTVRSQQAS